MKRAAPAARARGRLERELVRDGLRVAGVDEVGRGCIAGPVHAAVAILDFKRLARLDRKTRALVRDSKQLTAAQRQRMVPVLQDICLDYAIGAASVAEIEALGIVQATFAAMRRALQAMRVSFDVLLIDGKLPLAGYTGEQRTVVKGDSLCYSIAAASIFAKEARDELMRGEAERHPEYGFDQHVGYGTRHHLDMIAQHGICRLHRRNFDPVRRHSGEATTQPSALFEPLFDASP